MNDSQSPASLEVDSSERSQRICPLCGAATVSGFMTAPDRFHARQELYTLLQCSSCQCVWLANPPKPEDMGLHYSADYHKVIVVSAEYKSGRRWQEHQAIIARYKQGGAILDVGCSSGSFLAGMNNGQWKLYGIEMDNATAERARLISGAEVFAGDIMNAPFPANSFDVVTAFDVLEHMYEPREFLERVLYWLRPGGIFFARVPNIRSWEARLFGSYWYGLEPPRHLFHFSPRSMRQLVAGAAVRQSFITATEKGSHAGHSVRYLYEAFLRRLGFTPTPMAKARRGNIAWRLVRRALWVAVVVPFSWIASARNAGVIIDVIVKKEG